MMILNEIRYSNLDSLRKLRFVEAARKFPKELLRLFYKTIEDRAFKISKKEKNHFIERFTKELQDSFSPSNWWFERNNQKIFNDKSVSVYISKREGNIDFDISGSLMIKTLTFDFDERVGNVFDKIVNFIIESEEKFKRVNSGNLDDLKMARKELDKKYSEEKGYKFLNTIEKLFEKYGFNFSTSFNKEIKCIIKFNLNLLYPNVIDYLSGNLISIIKNVNSFQLNILKKKILPYFIKKIENNNLLLGSFIIMNNYIEIKLISENPDETIADKKITYRENHEEVKKRMIETETNNQLSFQEMKRMLVKDITREENQV